MTETIKTLEELLLDLKIGKYGMVGLTRKWLEVVRRTDEGALLSEAELIKKALEDILSGKVKEKEIETAVEKIRYVSTTTKADPSFDEKREKSEKSEKSERSERSKK